MHSEIQYVMAIKYLNLTEREGECIPQMETENISCLLGPPSSAQIDKHPAQCVFASHCLWQNCVYSVLAIFYLFYQVKWLTDFNCKINIQVYIHTETEQQPLFFLYFPEQMCFSVFSGERDWVRCNYWLNPHHCSSAVLLPENSSIKPH